MAIGVLGDTFPQVLQSINLSPLCLKIFPFAPPPSFWEGEGPIVSSPFIIIIIFFNFLLLIFSVYFNLQDAGYHFVAVVFFLSASVALAYITYGIGQGVKIGLGFLSAELLKIYRLYISAVVRKTHKFIVQNIKGTVRSWRMRYPN